MGRHRGRRGGGTRGKGRGGRGEGGRGGGEGGVLRTAWSRVEWHGLERDGVAWSMGWECQAGIERDGASKVVGPRNKGCCRAGRAPHPQLQGPVLR